jgi:hypothetical protein
MGWKSVRKGTNVNEELPLPRKTGGGLEKGLANLWSRKRIAKKAYAGRGQETKWEIPDKIIHTTLFNTMKVRVFYRLIPALAIVALISGCGTPINTFNLKGYDKSLNVGPRRVTGESITVAVVTANDAIFKLNSKVEPPVCTFIPSDGTPVQQQAKRVAQDKDATAVLVFNNYGEYVCEIVKTNFETRFAQANVIVSPTPVKADCVIEPHETFVLSKWGGLQSTVSLGGTFAGKQNTAESSCLKQIAPANMIWEIPVMIGTYPLGAFIVLGIDKNWTDSCVRSSVSTAWNESSGKLAGELAP